MKFFKILIITILVFLILLAVGLFVFIKTFDANRYKDQIARQIGEALQTEISIGNIELNVSLAAGVALTISDIRAADHGLLKGMNVHVEDAALSLDVMRFLRQREVYVSQVYIRKPVVRISLSRLQDGNAPKKPDDSPALSNPAGKPNPADQSSSLTVKIFRIDGGELFLIADQETPYVQDIAVTDITAAVSDIVLNAGTTGPDRPFIFQISAAAFDNPKAVAIEGKGRFDIRNQQVRADDVLIQSRLDDFSLNRIAEIFPAARQAGLSELTGGVRILVSQMIAGRQGVPVLSAKASWENGTVRTSMLAEPLRQINVHAEYVDGSFDIVDSTMELAGGTVTVNGRVEDVLAAQIFSFQVQTERLGIAGLIPPFHPDISIAGLADTALEIKGAGFDPLSALQNISGQAAARVTEGRIVNFNLLNFVFNQISFLPAVALDFQEALPRKFQNQLHQPDTHLGEVDVKTDISGGIVTYRNTIVMDAATLSANGTLDWKQQLEFHGSVSLDPELSAALIEKAPIFASLRDQADRIVIRLADYQGPAQQFRPMPDMQFLGKALVMSQVEQKVTGEVKRLLGDVLGVQQQPDIEQEQADDKAVSPDPQNPPKQDVIDNIFESIFR